MRTGGSNTKSRGLSAKPTPVPFQCCILLILVLTPLLTANAQNKLFDYQTAIRGLAIPCYMGTNTPPAAVIRVKEVSHDFQRRGFFRIGVLPLLILKGVTVEVLDRTRLAALLARVKKLSAAKQGADAIQIRDFSLVCSVPHQVVLRARSVRAEAGGRWRLEQGTVTVASSHPLSFHDGILSVSGPEAGTFTCGTAKGSLRISLFSLIPRNPQ